jgi:hypothetical protein
MAKINNIFEDVMMECHALWNNNSIKIIKMAAFAVSIAFIIGFLSVFVTQSFTLLPSVFKTFSTPLQNKKMLVTYIPSWQEFSTRQLVYSSLPKREVFDELDEELSADQMAIIDKVIVIPKLFD